MSTPPATVVARTVVDAALAGEAPADGALHTLLAPLAAPTQLVTVRRAQPGAASRCHHLVVAAEGGVAVLDRGGDDPHVVPLDPALTLRWVLAMTTPLAVPTGLEPDGQPLACELVVTNAVGPAEAEVVSLAWLDAGLDDAVVLVDGLDEVATTLPAPWATRAELAAAIIAATTPATASGPGRPTPAAVAAVP